MTPNPLHQMSTFWHPQYIEAARQVIPDDISADEPLAVGWKVTPVTGASSHDYYWPIVNGDHDSPVFHDSRLGWIKQNTGSCPEMPGDGLCVLTDEGISEATSGIVRSLAHCVGHVVAYPADSARSGANGKHRVPWCVAVDVFDPTELIRLGLVANLYGANLQGADLRGADLYGANLCRANLYGADLQGANLRGTIGYTP